MAFLDEVRDSAERAGSHQALLLAGFLVEAAAEVAADRGDNPALTGHFRGVELRRALELAELTTGDAPARIVRAGRALGRAEREPVLKRGPERLARRFRK
jgi:hypothetical protein